MTTATRTIRLIEAVEAAAAVAEIESWLDLPPCLVSTYPQVFGPDRLARLFGVFEDGHLVSHAAAQLAEIHVHSRLVRAVLIGSVATSPQHRRSGLASDLLRHICAVTQSAGCDLVMLWSDLWSFYEQLGFTPGGLQLELDLVSDGSEPSPGIRAATPADHPSILRLHSVKPVRVWRNLQHLELLMSTSPMTTMVLQRDDDVVAYACLGKGIDFAGWWHEFGGLDADVATLIQGSMTTLGLDRCIVMLPTYRAELPRLFDDASVRSGASSLCLPLSDAGCVPTFVDGLDSI